jgi:hypothetical protein
MMKFVISNGVLSPSGGASHPGNRDPGVDDESKFIFDVFLPHMVFSLFDTLCVCFG